MRALMTSLVGASLLMAPSIAEKHARDQRLLLGACQIRSKPEAAAELVLRIVAEMPLPAPVSATFVAFPQNHERHLGF